MPAMNGCELLEQYKNLDKKHERKCDHYYAYDIIKSGDEKKAYDSGAVTEFRQKPLAKEVLGEILNKHF